MSTRFTDYKQAYEHAVTLAHQCQLDVAIRKVKEYGKLGFNVSFASKNDSDYALAEIVTPSAIMVRATGVHGWPLVPSKTFPNETTLACPKCFSTDVTLSAQYPVQGTGPNGRGRLGDAGTQDTIKCNACGNSASGESKVRA